MKRQERFDIVYAPVAEVKARLSAYLNANEEGPVVVTRNGKPVGVLIPTKDEDDIERLVLGYSPRLQGILKASKDQIEDGRGISHEDFWEEMGTEE